MVKNEEPKTRMGKDEEMASDDFYLGSEHELDIIFNIISMLPLGYDTIT